MHELVRLRTRPSRNGQRFTYMLDFIDEKGKRHRISLGHSNQRKAERQRTEKERELRADGPLPVDIPLSELMELHRELTAGQVRPSTILQQENAMRHLIETIGNIHVADVRLQHGERFIQARIDQGRAMATAVKEVKALKRLFTLAVHRGQIEANPFRHLRCPRVAKQEIHVYADAECGRLIRAAGSVQRNLDWELLISTALCTGMRRGELLNLVWADIDFERQTARVAPKPDTGETWPWLIKDAERRNLPLTDDVLALLVEHQSRQPEGYPYVFVPPARYDRIQQRRRERKWTLQDGCCPVNNVRIAFGSLLRRAHIERGTFHDLRRTCITRWFEHGLSEFDVMKLAGHSDFATTHRFYLAVRRDLVERARAATAAAMAEDFGARVPNIGNTGARIEELKSQVSQR